MRNRILTIALLAATGLLVAACGDDSEPLDTGAPPDDTAATLPDADDPPGEGEPERVEPRSGMDNVRPRTFEEVEPVDDRTLAVRFWSGVEPCYVLDRAEVVETDDAVTITLYEGSDPAEPDAMCIEIAVWKEVLVDLDEPLDGREVVDGAVDAS